MSPKDCTLAQAAQRLAVTYDTAHRPVLTGILAGEYDQATRRWWINREALEVLAKFLGR